MRGGNLLVASITAILAGCLGDGPGGTPAADIRLDLDVVVDGLDDPVFVTHAGDGSGRLFIVEQGGKVLVWDGSAARTFLDLERLVSCCGERGLLGLAFHPDYADNGRVFVYYTAVGGDVTIARYDNADPASNVLSWATGTVLLTIEHSEFGNHNGGMLAFGPDGLLYAGVGDGGSGGDPHNNAQDLDSLLGKVLRLDVDRDCGDPVCRPASNPFVGKAGADEVWHYGLRNPWRFSFDRANGDLWIGDVGQNALEEIDHAEAGRGGLNFGWSRFEADRVYNGARTAPDAVAPVARYEHGDLHCSVTGGYVYRGDAIPALAGDYLFGDYCSGTIWLLRPSGGDWAREQTLDTQYSISSFGEDEEGELYVVDHGGAVYRLVAG